MREALEARGIPIRGSVGGGLRFRCPLCAKRPGDFSGSASERKDGAALVSCNRCAPGGPGGGDGKDRLLVSLGFGPLSERRRLFAPGREARGNYQAPEIPKEKPFYYYRAFDGTPIRCAVIRRPGGKDCPWFRFEGGRWIPGLAGKRPGLYNAAALEEAIRSGRLLIVAEGARKSEAFTRGGALAVGLPNGYHVSREVLAELLRVPGPVALFPDNESKGRRAMLEIADARWRAGRESRIVSLPGADFLGFDVIDALARGMKIADVIRLAEAAPAWAPSIVERAAAWLRETVKAGPVPAAVIGAKGAALGFGVRLLRRARRRAGVTSRRIGFGPGSVAYIFLASEVADFPSEALAVAGAVAS